ncbi:FAD dependent oxidoreductase [Geopyxis carbonaria]|nr:FAD dependent oxidoreductase [Geopyxis carbonaria]
MSLSDISQLHAFCNSSKCQCFQSCSASPSAIRSVLILGAGVFGLSTALHLLYRGQTNITIIDTGNNNDARMNKPLLSRDAAAAWRSNELLEKYFHETGVVVCSRNDNPVSESAPWRRGRTNIEHLVCAEDFRRCVSPALLGDMHGWKGLLCREDSGWIDAHGALGEVAAECRRLGALIITADIIEFIVGIDERDVMGARTSTGQEFYADRTVLTDLLSLVDFEGQVRTRYWTIAPAALYDENSAIQMRNRPVLVNADNGFFILEPDQSGQVMACHGLPAYSLPNPIDEGCDINQLLAETLGPTRRLAGMPRSCMSIDTRDGEFLITEHPRKANLIIAGGGGDAFEHLVKIGSYVADVVQRGEEGQRRQWRWRPNIIFSSAMDFRS